MVTLEGRIVRLEPLAETHFAALAGLLVARGVPDADLVVVVVSLAVVATLLLQSTTKPWLARRLGLLEQADG